MLDDRQYTLGSCSIWRFSHFGHDSLTSMRMTQEGEEEDGDKDGSM